MNVDEAMRRFTDTEEVPREALQWALDNWEQASPRLIAKLRAYAGRAQVSEADLEALFFIIYLPYLIIIMTVLTINTLTLM